MDAITIEGERILARVHQYVRDSYHGSNFHGPVVKWIVPWQVYSDTLRLLESASRCHGGRLGLSDEEVSRMSRNVCQGDLISSLTQAVDSKLGTLEGAK